MHASARRFSILLGLLALGCNDGGVMELELNLPPAPESFDVGPCAADGLCDEGVCEADRCIYRGEWYSQVEITSRFDFVSEAGILQWSVGQAGALEPIPLASGGEDTRWSCTSVLGDPSVEFVRVRLRYCRSLPCAETLQPDIEHWIEIERPFYGGQRTYVRRTAPSIPAASSRCATDTDCAGASEGPRCLASTLMCGCTDDAECPDGHCEGAQTSAGEGRCTLDIDYCRVTGCIIATDPLEAPDVCSARREDDPPGPRLHACERSPNDIEYVRPSGGGCFGIGM